LKNAKKEKSDQSWLSPCGRPFKIENSKKKNSERNTKIEKKKFFWYTLRYLENWLIQTQNTLQKLKNYGTRKI
jgi:hypothetical protein